VIEIEEWRAIPDYEGAYEASSKGRVRSLSRMVIKSNGGRAQMVGRALRQFLMQGYPKVTLALNGPKRSWHVHVLVCTAFHGRRPSCEYEAAHNDGNPLNCVPSNLRWATHIENEADKRIHGTLLCGEKIAQAKLTESEVRTILASRESVVRLARRFGVSDKQIRNIKHGRNWKHLDCSPPEKACELPNLNLLTLNGVSKSLSAWSRDLGIARKSIRDRIARGWSLEKTLSTPPDPCRGPKRRLQFAPVQQAIVTMHG
jgi:hypothetical protein